MHPKGISCGAPASIFFACLGLERKLSNNIGNINMESGCVFFWWLVKVNAIGAQRV